MEPSRTRARASGRGGAGPIFGRGPYRSWTCLLVDTQASASRRGDAAIDPSRPPAREGACVTVLCAADAHADAMRSSLRTFAMSVMGGKRSPGTNALDEGFPGWAPP